MGSDSGGILGGMQILALGRLGSPRTSPLVGQLIRFAAIGVISTLAYIGLYALLRTVSSPMASNAVALLVSAVGNTAANRRLTFGIRDRDTVLRDQLAGLVAFAVALGITSGSVLLLGVLAPAAGRTTEIAVLVTANVAATVVRFLLLRTWIGQQEPETVLAAPGGRAATDDHRPPDRSHR